MRVLIAFDKFKDALGALPACAAAAEALRAHHPDAQLDLCPLADGGEGFAEILTRRAGGELREASVTGPRGATITARFGLVPLGKLPAGAGAMLGLAGAGEGKVAVIEMAAASGLALLSAEQRDPWHTTSRGTGELIRAAAAEGVAAIILGVGGSATHDVGLGALTVLGLDCFSAADAVIESPVPATWAAVAKMGGKIQPDLPPILIACDVTNPLMGTFGAASVFAPQKGLKAEDFTRLEYMTGRMAALLCAQAGNPSTLWEAPGAGAAGGLAFGLMCATRAKLVPGFELVAAWLDLDRRIAEADCVLTGEGSFDASSLSGKGPAGVAQRALAAGKKVHVFAGAASAQLVGAAVHVINPAGETLPMALANTAANLRAAVGTVFPPA